MTMEIDRQSRHKTKRDSLADHLKASDFFPPGEGWNAAGTQGTQQQGQNAQDAPVSPNEPRQH
ncbi:MAG: hypothetical protein ABIP44_13255 [Pseudoxanthomonas sp.]